MESVVKEDLTSGREEGARRVARGRIVRRGGSLTGATAEGTGFDLVGAVVGVESRTGVAAVSGASPHGVLGGHGGGRFGNVDIHLHFLVCGQRPDKGEVLGRQTPIEEAGSGKWEQRGLMMSRV